MARIPRLQQFATTQSSAGRQEISQEALGVVEGSLASLGGQFAQFGAELIKQNTKRKLREEVAKLSSDFESEYAKEDFRIKNQVGLTDDGDLIQLDSNGRQVIDPDTGQPVSRGISYDQKMKQYQEELKQRYISQTTMQLSEDALSVTLDEKIYSRNLENEITTRNIKMAAFERNANRNLDKRSKGLVLSDIKSKEKVDLNFFEWKAQNLDANDVINNPNLIDKITRENATTYMDSMVDGNIITGGKQGIIENLRMLVGSRFKEYGITPEIVQEIKEATGVDISKSFVKEESSEVADLLTLEKRQELINKTRRAGKSIAGFSTKENNISHQEFRSFVKEKKPQLSQLNAVQNNLLAETLQTGEPPRTKVRKMLYSIMYKGYRPVIEQYAQLQPGVETEKELKQIAQSIYSNSRKEIFQMFGAVPDFPKEEMAFLSAAKTGEQYQETIVSELKSEIKALQSEYEQDKIGFVKEYYPGMSSYLENSFNPNSSESAKANAISRLQLIQQEKGTKFEDMRYIPREDEITIINAFQQARSESTPQDIQQLDNFIFGLKSKYGLKGSSLILDSLDSDIPKNLKYAAFFSDSTRTEALQAMLFREEFTSAMSASYQEVLTEAQTYLADEGIAASLSQYNYLGSNQKLQNELTDLIAVMAVNRAKIRDGRGGVTKDGWSGSDAVARIPDTTKAVFDEFYQKDAFITPRGNKPKQLIKDIDSFLDDYNSSSNLKTVMDVMGYKGIATANGTIDKEVVQRYLDQLFDVNASFVDENGKVVLKAEMPGEFHPVSSPVQVVDKNGNVVDFSIDYEELPRVLRKSQTRDTSRVGKAIMNILGD